MPIESAGGERSGLASTLRNSDKVWYLVFLLAIVASASMVFLPFLDAGLNDSELRFLLFLTLMSILALAIIIRLMPRPNAYDDFIEEQEVPDMVSRSTVQRAVEGRTLDQMGMYQELKSSFANRVRVRRGINEDTWELITTHGDSLRAFVNDQELVWLLTDKVNAGTSTDGGPSIFIYGDGFKENFARLLSKVEGWR